MESKWVFKQDGNTDKVENLSKELNVSKIIANMLVQRGIESFSEAKTFFRPELSHLHDPYLMKDMDKAIARLNKAIDNNEKILVYGDYDVDGTTSVALVYLFLKEIHKNIDYYIPDRYTEGYGISYKGVEFAADNNFDLVIALDCGIKANEKIKFANEKSVDFVICDHHTPSEEIPDAVAVLDPKQSDCQYPYKELSGCGVGFKLLQALSQKNNLSNEHLFSFLDLVALSIASDIVPITGENRVLAFYGLKRLNKSPRLGLKPIIEISQLKNKEITISDCVFRIGPKINAAGRIESGRSAVELLIAENKEYAWQMSRKINEYNETRQDFDRNITHEAIIEIKENDELINSKSTVLYNENWHKGVVGIVASRVIENFYKPTVILTKSNGVASGSARSVAGFNLYNAIEACSDLLESFGGHKHAAGLSLKVENIEKFRAKFESEVARTITPDQLTPKVKIDAGLNFKDITAKFYRIIKQFAPFGPENMSPVYITENVKDAGYSKAVGQEATHLSLDIKDGGNIRIRGIAFNLAEEYLPSIKQKKNFDICYSIEENEYMGRTSLQLRVKEIRIIESQN
ncbi:MAG: single-stranded-DNA-specific exonuclease RecJ [Bacteroidetes bacterium 4572_117]|nr:MAG: single-stranded-DNA-specific exonuclease RecJ [Bacteroidetes bacterium 4572_117]